MVMNHNELRQQVSQHCPLCDRPPQGEVQDDVVRGAFQIVCEVCKTYRITEEFLLFAHPTRETKCQLSAVVRRRFDSTYHPETITSVNWQDLVSSAPGKNDVLGKVRYLLRHIACNSHFPGERVILKGQTDYPVCFAANVDEFGFYAQYVKDSEFVDGQRSDQSGDYQYWLTPKGWQEVERHPTLDSPYAFVAMSFSKEGSRVDLLRQAFDEAIKPAIEDDAGYQEALRVDRKDFLGDICFEIIARIKESRFLVADVTEHKNGVYFEAGYAMGMGLPVIWMCHKDDMDKAHFDTSHLNHIVWDDIGEMRKTLATRILATIGRGPKRKLK